LFGTGDGVTVTPGVCHTVTVTGTALDPAASSRSNRQTQKFKTAVWYRFRFKPCRFGCCVVQVSMYRPPRAPPHDGPGNLESDMWPPTSGSSVRKNNRKSAYFQFRYGHKDASSHLCGTGFDPHRTRSNPAVSAAVWYRFRLHACRHGGARCEWSDCPLSSSPTVNRDSSVTHAAAKSSLFHVIITQHLLSRNSIAPPVGGCTSASRNTQPRRRVLKPAERALMSTRIHFSVR
jgi:hypothetical protein